MSNIKVAIVDDFALFRKGLIALIKSQIDIDIIAKVVIAKNYSQQLILVNKYQILRL